MMNQATQRAKYERGAERAQEAGIEVVGVGTAKDGRKVWCVPSKSHSGLWHVITLSRDGKRLQCDCMAGQHGQYCLHRAAVRTRIERDRAIETSRRIVAAALAGAAGGAQDAPLLRNTSPVSSFK
jgi:hypothetical protein